MFETIEKKFSVPVLPVNTKRVAVAVDRDLYEEAKELHIDMHTLFRMILQEAVDEMKKRKGQTYTVVEDFNLEQSTEPSVQTSFIDAMFRMRDDQPSRDEARAGREERVKFAAHSAGEHL